MNSHYKRYRGYLKPVFHYFLFGIILSTLFGLMGGILPLIAGETSQRIYDQVQGNKDIGTLLLITATFPVLFLIRGLLGYIGTVLLTYVSLKFLEKLKQDVFQAMQECPLSFFDRMQSGDLLARLGADTDSVSGNILEITKGLFKLPVQMVAAAAALIWKVWEAGELHVLLLSCFICPAIILPVRLLAKCVKHRHALRMDIISRTTQTLHENLAGIREIRAFNQQQPQTHRFTGNLRENTTNALRLYIYEFASQPLMELIGAIIFAFFYVYFLLRGHSFELMITVGLAAYFALDPVKRLTRLYNVYNMIPPCMERINVFFKEQLDNSEDHQQAKLPSIRGDVSFEGITFAYEERPALENVSVHINAGETIALVGPSGAGKSTFVNLLLGFYTPNAGAIRFDGLDIGQYSRQSLREQLALVPQAPTLFDDTVRANIALGKNGATDSEIVEAAKQAFAHDFIMQLPEGYDTYIGERGARLSGGQIQRLAVARAFLREAPIVVLDEATSALDADSEQKIKQALGKLSQGKTLFIVAHRFSTISQADRILVFEHGHIIAEGHHNELYDKNPLYTSLYNKQAGH